MSGVVFAPGSITEGKFGAGVALGAVAAIPPGAWFVPGAFVLTVPNLAGGTSAVDCPGGYVESDGVNAVLTVAGTVTKLGAGNPGQWPWPIPWPLPGSGA